MKEFDKHLHELLAVNPEATSEHTKLFTELPPTTQLAVMRRRRNLSQRAFAIHQIDIFGDCHGRRRREDS